MNLPSIHLFSQHNTKLLVSSTSVISISWSLKKCGTFTTGWSSRRRAQVAGARYTIPERLRNENYIASIFMLRLKLIRFITRRRGCLWWSHIQQSDYTNKHWYDLVLRETTEEACLRKRCRNLQSEAWITRRLNESSNCKKNPSYLISYNHRAALCVNTIITFDSARKINVRLYH